MYPILESKMELPWKKIHLNSNMLLVLSWWVRQSQKQNQETGKSSSFNSETTLGYTWLSFESMVLSLPRTHSHGVILWNSGLVCPNSPWFTYCSSDTYLLVSMVIFRPKIIKAAQLVTPLKSQCGGDRDDGDSGHQREEGFTYLAIKRLSLTNALFCS